jgi:MFS family permease
MTGPLRVTTLGFFTLGVLIAFEMLAVATVMPVVAADLGGVQMYALAFAAPLAISVLALTVAGPWMDRRGLLTPVVIGAGVFSAGLVVCGLAPDMTLFLLGRGIYGFGAGLLTVAMFVVAARCYTSEQRPSVFALYTSTFMVGALMGPVLAGTVADHLDWRWVFLPAPVFSAVAVGMLWRAIAPLAGTSTAPFDRRSLGWAAATALGILGLSAAGQRTLPAWPWLLAAAAVAVVVAVPRLLPAGTWRFRPGLPSTIAMRGLVGSAFLCLESYMPLALIQFRGCSPTVAGTALTVSAVMWFAGTWLCARPSLFNDIPSRLRVGMAGAATGLASVLLLLVDGVPLPLIMVGWAIGALGMGMTLPTLAVAVLDRSQEDQVGANSAATHLNDAVSQSMTYALGSVAFGALIVISASGAFAAVVVLSLTLMAVAVVPLRRAFDRNSVR